MDYSWLAHHTDRLVKNEKEYDGNANHLVAEDKYVLSLWRVEMHNLHEPSVEHQVAYVAAQNASHATLLAENNFGHDPSWDDLLEDKNDLARFTPHVLKVEYVSREIICSISLQSTP